MHRTGPIDSSLTSTSLSVAAARYLHGAVTTDQLLHAYYHDPRIKRLLIAASRQFRQSEDFIEELLQDLALLLVNKFIHQLTDPDKIYNVLHSTAVNKARRKSMKSSEDSLEAILERTESTDGSTSSVMEDADQVQDTIDERIDRERAVDEFNRRMALLNEGGQSMLNVSSSLPTFGIHQTTDRWLKKTTRPKKSPNDGTPSKEGVELNTIRQKIGYTLPEFAMVLNCPKGTLSSYMYGSVQNVPEKLLNEARSLLAQADMAYANAKVKFDAFTMEEIVGKWIESLGTFADDKSADQCLASAISVDRATVWRWRTRNMRPETRKLVEYDGLVRKAVVRLAAQAH